VLLAGRLYADALLLHACFPPVFSTLNWPLWYCSRVLVCASVRLALVNVWTHHRC
jgi:hypothetical protein